MNLTNKQRKEVCIMRKVSYVVKTKDAKSTPITSYEKAQKFAKKIGGRLETILTEIEKEKPVPRKIVNKNPYDVFKAIRG